MTRLEQLLKSEPALFTAFLTAAASLLAAFVFSASQTEQAAVVTIAAAAGTVLTAALTRPIKVATLIGAITTGLTAAAAFGLKVSPETLSLVSTLLAAEAAILVRLAPDVFALAHLSKPVPVPPAPPAT